MIPSVSRNDLGRRLALHLINRTTFGPNPGDIDAVLDEGFESFISRALEPLSEDRELDRRLQPLVSLRQTSLEVFRGIPQRPVETIRDDLYSGKVIGAVYAHHQLHEVLTDFWYNHFNVFATERYPLIASYERDAIRPHVLGRFLDLLQATAAHPAMLTYLDNTSNVANVYKDGALIEGLNENYGRELMELHTVSVGGGYTQKDVTEAARVFTGWQADFQMKNSTFRYTFVPAKHDCAPKRVMGLEVPADGEEGDGLKLLAYLALHPNTAHFVSYRLAQRLVADDPPESLVSRCAGIFLDTDGDLKAVTRAILTSDEFWSPGLIQSKVKSPLEFVVSALRAVSAEVSDARSITRGTLQNMGMLPYECSPPCGYSNRGADWISSSGQIHRFDFALRLVSGGVPGVTVDAGRLAGTSSDPRQAAITTWRRLFGVEPERGTTTTMKRARPDAVGIPAKVVGLALACPQFQWK